MSLPLLPFYSEPVPAHHCIKGPHTLGSDQRNIIDIPRELIQKIFIYLACLQAINSLREICKGWKHLIDHENFIEAYFPNISQGKEQPNKSVVYSHSFDFHDFDRDSSIGNRIAFFVRYLPRLKKKYPNMVFKEINLNHFPTLTPKMFMTLSQGLADNQIEVQTYHFKSKELSLKYITEFLKPFSWTHLLTSRSTIPNQKTLEQLIEGKIQLSDVEIDGDPLPHIEDKEITEEKIERKDQLFVETMIQFIQQGGLKSPCSLRFAYCTFSLGKIISALIAAKIKISRLEIVNTSCSTQDVVRLIQAEGLTSPCQLNFDIEEHLLEAEDVRFNKEIFENLTAKKIQLSRLSHYSAQDFDYESFRKFAQNSGLYSPFHFDMSEFTLDKNFVKVLSKSTLKHLILNFNTLPQYKYFDTLLKKGKWAEVGSLEFNNVRKPKKIVKSLLTTPFRIKYLNFDDLDLYHSDFAKSFRRLVRAHKFASPCKLFLYNQQVTPACLFELAAANVKIQELHLPQNSQFLEYGMIQLCHVGAFDLPCKIFLPHVLHQRKALLVLEALASTQVKNLSLDFDNFDPAQFLHLMENREHFKFLQVLRLYGSTHYDKAYDQKLAKAKPNMAIFIHSAKSAVPHQNQEQEDLKELKLEEINSDIFEYFN